MGFLREPSHLLIVAIVVIVLFGSRRLPDASRSLGRSLRIFKSEMQQMKDDNPSAGKKPANTDAPVEGRVVNNTDNTDHSATSATRPEQADAHRDA
ncbi:Sec-independent protein translocase subunit TatA [Spongisporangium articulatum]|uniref:Sec-independent protein translocase protein TatA n=1 Tax=Spongisporangium articulatum TaxID=3362603 RepID=A0ABW8AT06_9ACTN